MFQQDKTKWSYLAAMIDGEGCISIARRVSDHKVRNEYKSRVKNSTGRVMPYSFRVAVDNTSLTLMKWLIFNFGGVYYTKNMAVANHKTSYNWRPKGRANIEAVLLGILPYLVIKQEQAEIGLEYVRMNGEKNPDKREELYSRMRDLNRKGTAVTTNTPTFLAVNAEGMIESDLTGDCERAPVVMPDSEIEDRDTAVA